MVTPRSLVTPTTNPLLERALHEKLLRRSEVGGNLGGLEPLAIRLGLMQNTLKPRFYEPQLLMFAADHGLAVEGVAHGPDRPTNDTVHMLLTRQLPLAIFARAHDLELTVIDCGMADNMPVHDHLQMRKIAHATRNACLTQAMSLEQAHAGMRAGMEIGDKLRGNATVLAGVGVGSHESAALVLARMSDCPLRDLIVSGPLMDAAELGRAMTVLQAAQARHRDVIDPVEVLAAFGGYEVAVMVGVMLMAASKRHLLVVDGLPACAALMLAARIAQPVTDYCVFTRSHGHRGLDQALNLFRASALMELGMESTDGTGATLAWPLLRCAAGLLTEVADGEDAGPSQPDGLLNLPVAEPSTEPSPLGTPLY